MKPVYKCDYCSYMGTEEEVKEHEPKCFDNYDMKNCYTCKHKKLGGIENNLVKYKCEKEVDIPAGHIFNFCNFYERKEKSGGSLTDIFADMLGSCL